MGNCGAERNAEQIGNRHAGDHDADRRRPAPRRRNLFGNDAADAEKAPCGSPDTKRIASIAA